MSRGTTVHTSRTIMFAELEKVMAYGLEKGEYQEALAINVIGKRSKAGINKTAKFLRTLYGFDSSDTAFAALVYFWTRFDASDRSLLALIFAVSRDPLLAESVDAIRIVPTGEKVTTKAIEDEIERFNPNRYSLATFQAIARNLLSSWKQAGFIIGKVRSIRSERPIPYPAAAFALFLGYLSGARGDYVFQTPCAKALCLSDQKMRELALESARNGLMTYHHAGHVTSVDFNSLFKKIAADGNPH